MGLVDCEARGSNGAKGLYYYPCFYLFYCPVCKEPLISVPLPRTTVTRNIQIGGGVMGAS